MANVSFITVGNLKEEYLKNAVSEYKKRISQYAKITDTEIKEERIADEGNDAQIKRALDAEGEKILSSIPDGTFKIALCIEGKQYTSEGLAKIIESALDSSGKIAFIIGSSHGLSDDVKRASDLKLSFSSLTFPHQLMRVILAEAVYRSFSIIHGGKYHK